MVTSLLCVLASAAASQALDPARDPSQYVIRRWGAQSLRSNTVYDVLQTRDGYIWLGTTTGLVRYDGERFDLFDGRNTPAFGDGGAATLSEGTDGTLFVGTTAGAILQYRNGSLDRLVAARADLISALLADRDGSIWIGSYAPQVQRWRNGTLENAKIDSQTPQAIVQDRNGFVWIGTKSRGVVRYDGTKAENLPYTTEPVQAIHVDRAGTLWIGTPHGLVCVQGGRVTRLTTQDGLSHHNVTALLEDRHGSLWVGTAGGGLSRLTAGRWSKLTAAFDGLSDDHVRALAEDHEGNIWVGTADGLNCLSEGPFITYGRAQGLSDTSVTAVAPGANGSVWMGTVSGEVARLRGGMVAERFSLASGRGRDAVLALREMRDGSTWVALDNMRVLRLHQGVVSEQKIVEPARVGAFDEDGGGPILLAENRAHCRLENGRLVELYGETGPEGRRRARGGYPHMSLRDSRGTVWMGHRFGVSWLRGGKWKQLDAQSIPGERVRWLCEDPDGGIWGATSGGLAYIRDEKVHLVSRQHGLPENQLRLVLDDGAGFLWVASAGQIFRLDRREALAVIAGKARHVTPRAFDGADGLRTSEILLSNNPGFRAADGRLWFATSKGLATVNPRQLSQELPPPAVRVQEVRVNDTAYAADAPIDAPPGPGNLVVRYAALSYATPERLRFRYQLEGYDEGFVDAENRRTAYYTNLPPGRHRFRVMARNGDGPWSTSEATFSLYLAPHFYQTPWFAGVCLAAVLLAVIAAHRARVHKLEVTRRELAARVEDGLQQIKVLRGLLPTCASCKKIRDESGSWNHMESFITAHSEANFSHSVCPECMAKLYPDAYASMS